MPFEVFTWRPRKQPSVIRRKLGKEQAWGIQSSDGIIEIDSRLKGKREMEIYLHEKLHAMFQGWNEDEIIEHSRDLTEFMWGNSFRKVDLGDKQKDKSENLLKNV